MKGYYNIIYLDNDERYKIEIKDFNATWIDFDVYTTDSKELNKDIPIKIYNLNESFDYENYWKENPEKEPDWRDTYYIADSDNKTFTEISGKSSKQSTMFNLGSIIEFGENSTTIMLQDNETDNLEEIWILYGAPSNRDARALIKFNISSIPASQTIEDAKLAFFCYTNNWDDDVTYYRIGSQTWTEADNIATINALSLTNQTLDSSAWPDDDSWDWLNVTDIVSFDYLNGWSNSSFKLEDPDNIALTPNSIYNTTKLLELADSAMMQFRGKRYTTDITLRPYLNITYAAGGAPEPTTYMANLSEMFNMNSANQRLGSIGRMEAETQTMTSNNQREGSMERFEAETILGSSNMGQLTEAKRYLSTTLSMNSMADILAGIYRKLLVQVQPTTVIQRLGSIERQETEELYLCRVEEVNTMILNYTLGQIGDVSVHEANPYYIWLNFGQAPDCSVASIWNDTRYSTEGNLVSNSKRCSSLWDLTVLPDNIEILNSTLYLYGQYPHYQLPNGSWAGRWYEAWWQASNYSEGNGDQDGCNVSVEACGGNASYPAMAWNIQPDAPLYYIQDNVSVEWNTYYGWNVTNATIETYNSDKRLSIMIKDSHENDTIVNDTLQTDIASMQYGGAGYENYRPYLKVTYITYLPSDCSIERTANIYRQLPASINVDDVMRELDQLTRYFTSSFSFDYLQRKIIGIARYDTFLLNYKMLSNLICPPGYSPLLGPEGWYCRVGGGGGGGGGGPEVPYIEYEYPNITYACVNDDECRTVLENEHGVCIDEICYIGIPAPEMNIFEYLGFNTGNVIALGVLISAMVIHQNRFRKKLREEADSVKRFVSGDNIYEVRKKKRKPYKIVDVNGKVRTV